MTLLKFQNPVLKSLNSSPYSKHLNSLFDEFLGAAGNANYIPSANISETTEAYKIDFSAPGFTKESFKISVEDAVITVSGEYKKEDKETNANYSRKEFSFGSFKRSFTLPENINIEGIKANYENGILTVVLPKREEQKPTAIKEIKVS